MWSEAAKHLTAHDEAVLTGLDVEGYPFSVRVRTAGYDATTGVLAADLPPVLRPADGPAGLLCHRHDEKLWNISMFQVRGRIENTDDTWRFVTTAFSPPPRSAPLAMIRGAHTSAKKYLARRGLDRPAVNWAGIKEIQRRAAD